MKRFKILAVIAIIALAGCLVLGCSSDSGSDGGDAGGGGGTNVGFGGGKGGGGGGSLGPGPNGNLTKEDLEDALGGLLGFLGLDASDYATQEELIAAITEAFDELDFTEVDDEDFDDLIGLLGSLVDSGLMTNTSSALADLVEPLKEAVNSVLAAMDAYIEEVLDESGGVIPYVKSIQPTISDIMGADYFVLSAALSGTDIQHLTLKFKIGTTAKAVTSDGNAVTFVPYAAFVVDWGDGDWEDAEITIAYLDLDGTIAHETFAFEDYDEHDEDTYSILVPISKIAIDVYNAEEGTSLPGTSPTIQIIVDDEEETIDHFTLKGDATTTNIASSVNLIANDGDVVTDPEDFEVPFTSQVYTLKPFAAP